MPQLTKQEVIKQAIKDYTELSKLEKINYHELDMESLVGLHHI